MSGVLEGFLNREGTALDSPTTWVSLEGWAYDSRFSTGLMGSIYELLGEYNIEIW